MTIRISAIITTVITPTPANTALEALPLSPPFVSDGVVVGVLEVRVDICDTLMVLLVDVSEGMVEAAVIVVCIPLAQVRVQ